MPNAAQTLIARCIEVADQHEANGGKNGPTVGMSLLTELQAAVQALPSTERRSVVREVADRLRDEAGPTIRRKMADGAGTVSLRSARNNILFSVSHLLRKAK